MLQKGKYVISQEDELEYKKSKKNCLKNYLKGFFIYLNQQEKEIQKYLSMIKDPEKQKLVKYIQIKSFMQKLIQKKIGSFNTKNFKKLFYCKNVESYIKLKKTVRYAQILTDQQINDNYKVYSKKLYKRSQDKKMQNQIMKKQLINKQQDKYMSVGINYYENFNYDNNKEKKANQLYNTFLQQFDENSNILTVKNTSQYQKQQQLSGCRNYIKLSSIIDLSAKNKKISQSQLNSKLCDQMGHQQPVKYFSCLQQSHQLNVNNKIYKMSDNTIDTYKLQNQYQIPNNESIQDENLQISQNTIIKNNKYQIDQNDQYFHYSCLFEKEINQNKATNQEKYEQFKNNFQQKQQNYEEKKMGILQINKYQNLRSNICSTDENDHQLKSVQKNYIEKQNFDYQANQQYQFEQQNQNQDRQQSIYQKSNFDFNFQNQNLPKDSNIMPENQKLKMGQQQNQSPQLNGINLKLNENNNQEQIFNLNNTYTNDNNNKIQLRNKPIDQSITKQQDKVQNDINIQQTQKNIVNIQVLEKEVLRVFGLKFLRKEFIQYAMIFSKVQNPGNFIKSRKYIFDLLMYEW